MKLGEYLTRERILLDVEGDSPEAVIRSIASLLGGRPGLPDRETIGEALLARERSHSTSLGGGVAVPHATLSGVERPTLAVVVPRTPIEYGGVEPGSVRVLFVLLSPPGFAGDHIKLLARVCRLVRQETFTESLAAAQEPSDVLSIIEDQDTEWA